VFVVRPQRDRRSTGAQFEIDARVVGVSSGRRGDIGECSDQDGGGTAVEVDSWKLGVVLESWCAIAGVGGLGDPELDAVEVAAVAVDSLLGVGNAVACGHEVELARFDHLLGAQRVAVQRGAVE
jgi:hypothetical protein